MLRAVNDFEKNIKWKNGTFKNIVGCWLKGVVDRCSLVSNNICNNKILPKELSSNNLKLVYNSAPIFWKGK